MGGSGGAVGDVPFVGRRAELALLRDRLAAAVRTSPPVVQVEGPPGIGKTALVERFLAEATDTHRRTDAGPAGVHPGAAGQRRRERDAAAPTAWSSSSPGSPGRRAPR